MNTNQIHAGRQCTNAGGLVLNRISHPDTQPCWVCGRQCGVEFVGFAIHPPCFERTTATTVQDLARELRWINDQRLAAHHNPPAAPPVLAREQRQPETEAKTPPAPPTASGVKTAVPQSEPQRRAFPAKQPMRVAAIVDTDRYWLPDGTESPLPYPIRHLGHLEQLGRDLNLGSPPAGWHTDPEAGVIIPTAALWSQLGVDVTKLPSSTRRRKTWLEKTSEGLPALLEAVKDGWVFGRGDETPLLKGATRVRRADQEVGRVRILMSAGLNPELGLTEGDVDPVSILRRLQMFANLVGFPFANGGSPLSTAIDLFQAITPKGVRERLVPTDWDGIAPAYIPTLERHFDWTRPPNSQDLAHQVVMFWDRGQSYLATWGNITVGFGRPEHLEGPVEFNPKLPGWWRITVPDARVDGHKIVDPYPDLLDPHGDAAGTERWVTTPALLYATKNLDVTVEISEAWVWPAERSGRALEKINEALTGALKQLIRMPADDEDAQAVMVMVKSVYKQFSGYFMSNNAAEAKSVLHQPYWFHATIAQARVALLHQILTTGNKDGGAWPLVVSQTDLIGYATDQIGDAGWPGDPSKLGYAPGQYKPAYWAPIEDHTAHLTGGKWPGFESIRELEETGESS